MNLKSVLNEFLPLAGVSGHEGKSAAWLATEFKKYCDEVYIDASESVVGIKKAKASLNDNDEKKVRKMMFAAHLDQVGLVVSKIEEGGILRINGLGYDPKILPGQRVVVFGRKNIDGVIGYYPNKECPSMNDLFIDTGLASESIHDFVRVGDLAKVELSPISLKNGFYCAPFLDDRSCVVAMLAAMKNLTRALTDCDIYFVATSGEETTGKGACATAHSINPDLAIIMDVTFGAQPGTKEPQAFTLGKGLTSSVGPLFDPYYRTKIEKIAKKEHIKVVAEADSVGFGTDASSIRTMADGIPVVLISLPIKSMHTPVETCLISDIQELARWITAICKNINLDFIEEGRA